MITKNIYSYKVRIKYGVYTRTIIGGVFPPISLLQSNGTRSLNSDVEYSLGFPSGTGYRGSGDNPRQRSILARRLTRLLKANRWTFDVGTIVRSSSIRIPDETARPIGNKKLRREIWAKRNPNLSIRVSRRR